MNKHKTKLLLTVICTVFATQVFAQDSTFIGKNTINLNLVQLGFNTYSLMYERDIKSNNSLSIGVSYHPPSTPPLFLLIKGYALSVAKSEFASTSIVPEFRHYLTKCGDGNIFASLYIGGYLKYANYRMDATVVDRVILYNAKVDFKGVLNEFGVGFQMGYKATFFKRWTLDFMAFGPRMSRYYYNINLDIQGESDVPDQIQDFFNNKFDDFGIKEKVDLKSDLKYRHAFNFANFRYGLAVGYAF